MKWRFLFVGVLVLTGKVQFQAMAQFLKHLQLPPAISKSSGQFPARTDLQPHGLSALSTKWAGSVSATNVLPEYPRPNMVRPDWLNLNGPWEFAVVSKFQTSALKFSDRILVPFPVESRLSGVKRHFISEMQRLWYRRQFDVPDSWHGQRILLHFDASDWETQVWINGQEMGVHQGGYDRFSFDITDALKSEGHQELLVSVYDPTDSGFQPVGKQMLRPRPPFFSACSGIWQTVWLEPIPTISIESLKLVPDIDAGVLKMMVQTRGVTNDVIVKAVATDGETPIGEATAPAGAEIYLPVPHAKLWSPDNPFLYRLNVFLVRNGAKIDSVSSYFGMRKISMGKDQNGNPLLMLNNQPMFEFGPLDQGYWPDGIYTAPTDDALRNDIDVMKHLGFNMCRKHVKIESDRWYYWCDKLGLLVWQDMPNGDRPATPQHKEIQRQPESSRLYEQDLKRMIAGRGNHPCIVMWIAFNQGWGQFDTVRIANLIKVLDPSRLIIDASGWYDMGVGDVRSLHQYPGPPSPEHDGKRAYVVGECGGLGMVITNHIWGGTTHWNTRYFNTVDELYGEYAGLIVNLKTLKDKDGLAGAVVTQLTDVEKELNGFMTYDRAIIKMPPDKIRQLSKELIQSNGTGKRSNTSTDTVKK